MIAACDGDVRTVVRALIIAKGLLEAEGFRRLGTFKARSDKRQL